MKKYPLFWKGFVVVIVFLFVGNCVIPTNAQDTKKLSQPSSMGNWWYVGGNGTGNYTKIQDAIENASDGDTVFVYSGTYYERLLINKTLYLKSIETNKGKPILDANKTGAVVRITGEWCKIDGFIVKNAGVEFDSKRSCFFISGRYCTIRNCECRGYSYTGIYIKPLEVANYAQIINNTISTDIHGIYLPYESTGGSNNVLISQNTIYGTSQAIELNAGKGYTISNNKIYSNTRGILFRFGGNHEIIGNNISDNSMYGVATVITDYNDLRYYIKDNVIKNNDIGIELKETYRSEIQYNIISENRDTGVYFVSANNNQINNNVISSNAKKGVFFVDSNNNQINNNAISSNGDKGIYFDDSNNNQISNNTISYNLKHGVNFFLSTDNLLKFNILRENKIGALISFSNNNLIQNNNFLKNNINSLFFGDENNEWVSNYWNRPRFLPKPIFGIVYLIPKILFDMNPAKEPFDIY